MKQKQVLCFKGVEDVEEEIVTFLIGNYLPPKYVQGFRKRVAFGEKSYKSVQNISNLLLLLLDFYRFARFLTRKGHSFV